MQVQITKPQKAGHIAEGLFGGNMEPTRRTVWQGLSAQMVANRKFAANCDGVPCRWTLEGTATYADTRDSVCQSARVCLGEGGVLSQGEIALTAGYVYTLALWMSSTSGGRATVRIDTAAGCLLEQPVTPMAVAEASRYTFTAPVSEKAVLSISCDTGSVAVEVVSLLPADALCGMRRDVIAGLKELGMKELRFPGGCYAEVYNWKNGLVEPDRRAPLWPTLYPGRTFLLRYTDGVDNHEIGINEFMVLCREIGAEPVLTVPVICSELQDGLDWLQYCNGGVDTFWGHRREAAGFPEPFGVRQWCIGNEIYYFGQRMEEDPAYAAQVTGEFIREMKKIDPTVYAIAAFCPERREWNRTYLTQMKGLADGISLHFYMTDEFKPNFGHITEEMCLTVVENSLRPLVKDACMQIRQIMGKDMPIHMDEWAFTWGQQGNTVNAFVDARLLRFLCAEGEKYGIVSALYFHPVNEGMLVVEPGECQPDCFARLYTLFQPHCGRKRLEVSTELSGGVELVASEAPDGSVYLTALSLNNTQEISLCPVGYRIETVTQLVPEEFSTDCREYRTYGQELLQEDGLRLLPLGVAGIRLVRT